jgi:hypothetical protein
MRYSFGEAPFEDDFIEYSDNWSRAQVRATWEAVDRENGGSEANLLDRLRPKIIALHLTCGDGSPPITDPLELTPERTDEIDIRLYSWFAGTWVKHLGELATLGNAFGRTLFAISDVATVTAPESQNHSLTPGF